MSKFKNLIIFIVIGLIMVFVFFAFFSNDENPELLTSSTNTLPSSTQTSTASLGVESELAKDFLALLLSVKNISLNDSIFTNNAFGALRDSSIIIVHDGSEGRPNPFAPIGSDSVLPRALNLPQSQRSINAPSTTTPTSSTSALETEEDFNIFSNLDLDEPDLSFEEVQ